MLRIPFILLCLLISLHLYSRTDTLLSNLDFLISENQIENSKNTFHQWNFKSQEEKENAYYEFIKLLIYHSKYEEALKLSFDKIDQISNSNDKSKYQYLIANIYYEIFDYTKAKEYFEIVISNTLDQIILIKSHMKLYQLYFNENEFHKGKKHLSTAKELSENYELEHSLNITITMLHLQAEANYHKGNQQGNQFLSDSNHKTAFDSCFIYNIMGINYDSLHLTDSSNFVYQKGLELAIRLQDPETIKSFAWKLKENAILQKEDSLASFYLNIYIRAESDSNFFTNDKYRNLFKIEENRLLKLQKNKFNNRLLFISICIILFFSILFFYLLKRKVNTQKYIDKKDSKTIQKLSLNEETNTQLKLAFDSFIKSEMYLEQNMTLKVFTKRFGIKTEKYVSHYINSEYDKNYSQFLSDLRIEYFINKIKVDANFRKLTIESISKELGFSTKRSFEIAFQKKTGTSPYKFIIDINK